MMRCMVSLVEWRGWDRVSVDSGPASRRLMTPPVDSHYRLQICESYTLPDTATTTTILPHGIVKPKEEIRFT